MPYVTSVERLAKAEGIAEGIAEGGAMVLLKPLDKLCGPLPEDGSSGRHQAIGYR